MGPSSFFAICFEFGDHGFKKKKTKNLSFLLSDKVSFLSPPPPLPGWRSQPNSAVGSWHRQVFRHLAGWQAPRFYAGRFPRACPVLGLRTFHSERLAVGMWQGMGVGQCSPAAQGCDPQQSPSDAGRDLSTL